MSLYEKLQEKLNGVILPGSLVIHLDDKKIGLLDGQVNQGSDDADCSVSMTSETLESIISGGTDPMNAYFSGDLKITGDLGVAMALSKILKA